MHTNNVVTLTGDFLPWQRKHFQQNAESGSQCCQIWVHVHKRRQDTRILLSSLPRYVYENDVPNTTCASAYTDFIPLKSAMGAFEADLVRMRLIFPPELTLWARYC